MTVIVAPTEMPMFETAERLLLAHMESCHNTFPFLAKKVFMNEFYHCEWLVYDYLLWTNGRPLDYAALTRGTSHMYTEFKSVTLI